MNAADALGAAHSALDPAGVQAARIASLAWVLVAVAVVVWVVVTAVLAWALVRRRPRPAPPDPALDVQAEYLVAAATVVTLAIVVGLVATSYATGRRLASLGSKTPVTVRITGHQWWWEVEYEDATPSRVVRAANEMHVPVGEPVRVDVTSFDVIHSLWVPALHGKIDLIPGRQNTIWLQADRAGEYRGQCAEFCGHQHANMAILIVAEPRAAFDAWLEAERRPAAEPASDAARAGRDVFARESCALCHTIHGTGAAARVGPDLTHLMSRRTIAAGTLPNVPGHLAGWIVDPQALKPGVLMPPNHLAPADLQALLAYLEGLA